MADNKDASKLAARSDELMIRMLDQMYLSTDIHGKDMNDPDSRGVALSAAIRLVVSLAKSDSMTEEQLLELVRNHIQRHTPIVMIDDPNVRRWIYTFTQHWGAARGFGIDPYHDYLH